MRLVGECGSRGNADRHGPVPWRVLRSVAHVHMIVAMKDEFDAFVLQGPASDALLSLKRFAVYGPGPATGGW